MKEEELLIDACQNILERVLKGDEYVKLIDLLKDYDRKDIQYWVFYGKFKDRPIDYARACVITKCKKKNEETGSKWLDDLKKKMG